MLLIASGLSKGYAYLMAPIIFSLFGAVLLGNYVMITTVSLLLSQVISLNPTAVIIRSSADKNVCIKYTFYYYLFSLLSLVTSGCLYLLLGLLSIDTYYALFWLLASAEALLTVTVAHFRANDLYIRFVFVALCKSVFIGSYLFFAEPNLHRIILFSAGVAVVMSALFILDKFWRERRLLRRSIYNFKQDDVIGDFLFGVRLIPHSFGLWGFSSATKVILKLVVGAVALGFFTVYFTFSFPIVLVNSALTLYLPREIVRDPSNFISKKKDLLAFKGYTLFVLTLNILILMFCYFDNTYNFYIKSYSYEVILCIVISCLIFYNFGAYQFLSNYLFFTKNSGALSKNTIVSAVLSVLLSVVLSHLFGVLGAVTALYLASLFYVYITFKSANSIYMDNNTALIWRLFCIYAPCLLGICSTLGFIVL